MTISQRVGKSSFKLIDLFGHPHDAHMNQLKPFVCTDSVQDVGTLLTFNRNLPTTQKRMGHIRDHRLTSANRFEFLVHWDQDPASEGVWEDGKAFAQFGTLPSLWAYCQKEQVPLSLEHVL